MSVYNSSESAMNYNSSIEDLGIDIDFDYYPTPNHSMKFGFAETYHTFNPGVTVQHYTKADSIGNINMENQKQYGHEMAAYIEDDMSIGSRLKANVGIRWSGFKVGAKFYNAFEPRLSARMLLADKWSIKGAYAQMNQYITCW